MKKTEQVLVCNCGKCKDCKARKGCCSYCGGSGSVTSKECNDCMGTGFVKAGCKKYDEPCHHCNGKGNVYGAVNCPKCHGKGY